MPSGWKTTRHHVCDPAVTDGHRFSLLVPASLIELDGPALVGHPQIAVAKVEGVSFEPLQEQPPDPGGTTVGAYDEAENPR